MKAFRKILIVLAAVLLAFGLAVAALNVIFSRTGWLIKEYRELGVEEDCGISPEDASRVLSRMMYYAVSRESELQTTIVEDGEEVDFFNEDELSHMVDVRKLASTVMWMGAAALAVSVIALIVLIVLKKKEALRFFAKAYLIVLGAALVVIIALAVWILVDFDSFWRMFHVVFLDLESSTFNPLDSRMIRICPAELFADFIGRLGSYAAIFAGGAAVISAVCLFISRRRSSRGE